MGSNETPDSKRSLIASTKSGLITEFEAESTISKRSIMPRSLMKNR